LEEPHEVASIIYYAETARKRRNLKVALVGLDTTEEAALLAYKHR
jgi:hypothetical protein